MPWCPTAAPDLCGTPLQHCSECGEAFCPRCDDTDDECRVCIDDMAREAEEPGVAA